ncbi:MAG: hypothetical protein LBV15_06075, partial [Planctomycetota bacterium]|nr:hypothetical protein [Planctomycetota bacterium]
MNKKLFFGLALLLGLAAIVSFRPPAALESTLAATDVVAIYAKSSFARLLEILPEKPAASPDRRDWRFSAPDGSAEVSWAAGGGQGDKGGVTMRSPAAPFLAAGLDASRLPEGMIRDGMLTFALEGGAGGGAKAASGSPAGSFANLLDLHRDRVAYHFQLGHFG